MLSALLGVVGQVQPFEILWVFAIGFMLASAVMSLVMWQLIKMQNEASEESVRRVLEATPTSWIQFAAHTKIEVPAPRIIKPASGRLIECMDCHKIESELRPGNHMVGCPGPEATLCSDCLEMRR